jgi:hypothetical protein
MVVMQTRNLSVALRVSVLFLLFFPFYSVAEYVEGTDTTDENGYGFDSSFQITKPASYDYIIGPKIYCYSRIGAAAARGSFNYVFDEINIVPDSLISIPDGKSFFYPAWGSSFAITNSKNKTKTYSKLIIMENLGNNRYKFKYGANTEQNGKLLIGSDYDRSIRYKPNNLYYSVEGLKTFSWSPPLPNNNHLQGYTIYIQNKNISIDTTAPINMAQWDSVGFTDTTWFSSSYYPHGEFFNIVAVYAEGKSDFLKGWTRLAIFQDIKKNYSPDFSRSSISIKYIGGKLSVVLNQQVLPVQLDIFTATGKRLGSFKNFKCITPALIGCNLERIRTRNCLCKLFR